jgi:hypothetical protein
LNLWGINNYKDLWWIISDENPGSRSSPKEPYRYENGAVIETLAEAPHRSIRIRASTGRLNASAA